MARKNKENPIEPEKIEYHPAMRIYLSVTSPDGNHLTCDEFLDTIEQDSIADFCKFLIDKGLLNVYYAEFNRVERII